MTKAFLKASARSRKGSAFYRFPVFESEEAVYLDLWAVVEEIADLLLLWPVAEPSDPDCATALRVFNFRL